MFTDSDLKRLEQIKRRAIIAMVSDDMLMERLVLKGGNALDLIYGIAPRASSDLDFSIEGEFPATELAGLEDRVARLLETAFGEVGYHVFDVSLTERPEKVSREVAGFWGGYAIEFKVIERDRYTRLGGDLARLRRNATVVAPREGRTFQIEVSKFEHCAAKHGRELEGYTVYVYTLEMLLVEKLRAICQQTPGYAEVVPSHRPRARAKDFFDIYAIMEHLGPDMADSARQRLIRDVFEAKRVPLRLLGEIHGQREFHRPDFASVQETLKPDQRIEDFDFYFDYVLAICRSLEPLWKE